MMLLFKQSGLKYQAQELQSKVSRVVFTAGHLRISIVFLLLSFWLVWILVLSELLYSYSVNPKAACMASTECSLLSLIVGLHASVLLIGTVGWICSSPTLTSILIVPPLCFGGALTGVEIDQWIADSEEHGEPYSKTSALLCFLCFWMFIMYAVVVIRKYCSYLKQINNRRRFNVDVFKERVFGTPPLKEFNRMEFARCSHLSDSQLDDIFDEVTIPLAETTEHLLCSRVPSFNSFVLTISSLWFTYMPRSLADIQKKILGSSFLHISELVKYV
ncbi:hypothetical protein GCK32_008583 [Trichostrongylus colubriformis]|uniref:Uncharacterized protein n=1 Tax=Trichostrongylus colubriformis TaxID=6319 RepID=A0AAN8FLJ7_TRICO